MNIFTLDRCPIQSAKWLVNKHCVKMPLETAQILCSVYRTQNIEAPYKLTHKNHPSNIWARESKGNFDWLCVHGLAICQEYTARYGKKHKSELVIDWCVEHEHLLKFDLKNQTEFALAMPDEYKCVDSVRSYRIYYKYGKSHLHDWKMNKPDWI